MKDEFIKVAHIQDGVWDDYNAYLFEKDGKAFIKNTIIASIKNGVQPIPGDQILYVDEEGANDMMYIIIERSLSPENILYFVDDYSEKRHEYYDSKMGWV